MWDTSLKLLISHGILAKVVTLGNEKKLNSVYIWQQGCGDLGFSSLKHIENTSQGQFHVFGGGTAVKTQFPLQVKMDIVLKRLELDNVPCLSSENFSLISSFIFVLLIFEGLLN